MSFNDLITLVKEDIVEVKVRRTHDGMRVQIPRIKAIPGKEGPQGTVGIPGKVGPQGPPGRVGDKGDRGDQGLPGPQGPVGPIGPEGPPGPQGIQGVPGQQGPQGNDGERGPPGPPGTTGKQGIQGVPGQQGPPGIRGEKGDQGPPGPQGKQGPTGDQGPQGPPGPKPIKISNTILVDSRLGDDSTAELESSQRPFASLAVALAALPERLVSTNRRWRIVMAPGEYPPSNNTSNQNTLSLLDFAPALNCLYSVDNHVEDSSKHSLVSTNTFPIELPSPKVGSLPEPPRSGSSLEQKGKIGSWHETSRDESLFERNTSHSTIGRIEDVKQKPCNRLSSQGLSDGNKSQDSSSLTTSPEDGPLLTLPPGVDLVGSGPSTILRSPIVISHGGRASLRHFTISTTGSTDAPVFSSMNNSTVNIEDVDIIRSSDSSGDMIILDNRATMKINNCRFDVASKDTVSLVLSAGSFFQLTNSDINLAGDKYGLLLKVADGKSVVNNCNIDITGNDLNLYAVTSQANLTVANNNHCLRSIPSQNIGSTTIYGIIGNISTARILAQHNTYNLVSAPNLLLYAGPNMPSSQVTIVDDIFPDLDKLPGIVGVVDIGLSYRVNCGGNIITNGSQQLNVRNVSGSNINITSRDFIINIVPGPVATTVISLPATLDSKGRFIHIHNSTNSAVAINGVTSDYLVAPNKTGSFFSMGTEWSRAYA